MDTTAAVTHVIFSKGYTEEVKARKMSQTVV